MMSRWTMLLATMASPSIPHTPRRTPRLGLIWQGPLLHMEHRVPASQKGHRAPMAMKRS